MSTYVKPQVLVYQEFSLAPNEITDPLRAHISGPNAMLHRFAVAAEKALINVGPYNKLTGGTYPWPDRQAGSLIDAASVKLFIDNALLLYFEDLIGVESNGRGLVAPVTGKKNWIRHNTVAFKANGTQWPRSGLLNDRDVRVGDIVYIRGIADPDDTCVEHELWTEVLGFASDEVDAIIFAAVRDDNNQVSTDASHTITFIGGPVNCIGMSWDGASVYDGLADGLVTETYTVEVTKSSVAGCAAARLRITSDSGTDDVDEVDPGDLGDVVDIGTRGVKVVFAASSGSCTDSASSNGVESGELIIGQKWEIEVTQAFERVCIQSGDVYTGPDNDTYIIEVTKGGLWADLPEITVTTVKGLDSSGPTTVTGANAVLPIGSFGLTGIFRDCGNLPDSLSISENAESGMGDNDLDGLRKGDKFYISVTSGQNGPIRTLILRDDVPAAIRAVTDLDLRLFISKTIEVTENRLSAPPLVNYELESTQLLVKSGITAYDTTWTLNAIEQPLVVFDGRSQSTTSPTAYGIMYIEYREWLATLSNQVNFIEDVADLDDIPGQLDELNPLKWGVFRALQGSNKTRVGYTGVTDPTSLDSWQDVIERVKGRDDLYNFVPVLTDTVDPVRREVQNLFDAQVDAESSPEAGNWKGMFVNIKAKTAKMVVGMSDADTQALRPTSVDGDFVLATLEDNPEATDTQYTLLSVPANNSGFITYGVLPGDIVRFLFTIDAFGDATYREFIVDSVLSQNSLLLLHGHTDPITVPQKMEIWHTLNKNEIVTDLVDQAQSFASRRVVAVWPDVVGTGGNAQDGNFLCCTLAGLVSGVVPHQGLTNVEIPGYDDLAARTKDFFSSTQLNDLAAGGVWIATEDRDGTPHTRHALTTDTTDLNRKEEMIRRNVDSISYLFLRRLRPFIGRTNATPSMLRKLRYEVMRVIKFLKGNGYTAELGPQLIDGSIALDATGNEILRIHPLAADRVEIVLNLVVPAPLNNIELHLVV
jgi:hypothetical protein